MILITRQQWRFWRYVANGSLANRRVAFLTPRPGGAELYTIADLSHQDGRRWLTT